jgi:hypothetical protein
MKTGILLIATIMVLGFNASAESAYARTCRIAGGQQWAVSMDSEFDTSLCLFNQAAVGAAEFAQYKWGQGLGQSLKTFLNQDSHLNVHGVCDVVGAAHRVATDTEGATWELCKFVDGSVVEAKTLAAGVNDPVNADLVNALK